MSDHGWGFRLRGVKNVNELQRSVMNKIVEDATRGYEVNIWASLTERDNIQASDTNRVGKVA